MLEFPLVPLVPFDLPAATGALTALAMLCFVLYLGVASLAVGGSALLLWLSIRNRPIEPVRRALLHGLPIAIPTATAFAIGPLLTALLLDPQAGATLRATWLAPHHATAWVVAGWFVLPITMTFAAWRLRRLAAGTTGERVLALALFGVMSASTFGWALLHVIGREDPQGQPGVAQLDLEHWLEVTGRSAIGLGLSLAGAGLLLRHRLGLHPGRRAVRCVRGAMRTGAALALVGALVAGYAMAAPVPRDRLSVLLGPAASAYPLALVIGCVGLILATLRRARGFRVLPAIAWVSATIGLAGIRETVRIQTLEFGTAVARHTDLATRQGFAWVVFGTALIVTTLALWRRWSRPNRSLSSSS